MPIHSRRGALRFVDAFKHSFRALNKVLRHEAAFQQEIAFFVVATPIAVIIGDSGADRALMIGSMILVLIVELVNTAIEAVVDRIGEEYHELSGHAKDLGSAAVLLALANVIITWGLVLFT